MKNKRAAKNNSTSSLIKFLLFVIFIETLLLIHLWPKKQPISKKVTAPTVKITKIIKKAPTKQITPETPKVKTAKLETAKVEVPKPKPEITKPQLSKPEPSKAALTKLAMAIPMIKPRAKITAKVSIVIDDWGYNLEDLNILREINTPLTLAILPHLAYSKNVAEFAKEKGWNAILHMPMEPHANPDVTLEKNTILTTMDDNQIRTILKSAMESVPGIKGINNHMGSAVTEDERTMKIIFTEMKKSRLFFLDSFVTDNSICKNLAKKMHIGFAERNIFLDNTMEAQYIKDQIMSLVDLAKKQGFAIGIGHDRKLTLEILKEMLPKLSQEGIKFVPLSELVKK